MGFKTGVLQFPPPYFGNVLSEYTKQESKFQNLFKNMWILHPHGIFMLPSSIFRTVVGPMDFYQPYNSISEHFDLYVQYSHWLDLKISLCLYLNHMLINNMVRIMYVSFKKRDMK